MFEFNPVPKPKKNRPQKMAICNRCGVEFSRRSDLINRHANNYCSHACASIANGEKSRGRVLEKMRKGTYKNCEICNKEFYVVASRTKKNSVRFCSLKCRGKWQAEQPLPKGFMSVDNSGSKNGRYKDGKRIGERISKPNVRKEVIKRDGNWCLFCGKPPKGLHLHRVVYGSQNGKYEPGNCVQLCLKHHELVHSSKQTWQPILLDYLDGVLKDNNVEPIEPASYWMNWFVKHKISSKL